MMEMLASSKPKELGKEPVEKITLLLKIDQRIATDNILIIFLDTIYSDNIL